MVLGELDKFFSRGGAPLYPIPTAIYSILFLIFNFFINTKDKLKKKLGTTHNSLKLTRNRYSTQRPLSVCLRCF